MFILVIIAYGIVGIIEIPPLVKKGQRKEFILYSIFFIAAFLISLLLSLGIEIPSPAVPIERAVRTIIEG